LGGDCFEGLVLPKIESREDLDIAERLTLDFERRLGVPAGRMRFLPIIETARGVLQAQAIAAGSHRNVSVIFGAADLSLDLDLDLDWGSDELELLYARAQIAHACRAAGIGAPIDTATLQVRDLDGFIQSARNGRRLGFQGKLCLHPDQILPCHGVYTPDAAQVMQAERIVDAYEAALQQGHAAIEVDGTFVDEPVAERARRLLRRSHKETLR
jgi:citrate lyase subunit beta/citryl-CoA lyase